MSSTSSYDGSDKDLFHQRTSDGFMPRQSYLRKTDLLELNDSSRSSRDTDIWSVSATVDDQESVISTNTQKSRLVPDLDDDPFTSTASNHNNRGFLDSNAHSLDLSSFHTDTMISQLDARSTTTNRSLAAECEFSLNNADPDDDDIGGSTQGRAENQDRQDSQHVCDDDDDQERRSHRHHYHHDASDSPVTMDDSIRAPTEPQPSFTTIGKTYEELIEENELLHAQLRHLEITTKHQQNIISNRQPHHSYNNNLLCVAELNSNILSKQLATWAERVTHFAGQWTISSTQQRQVEQDLFHHVIEYYLHALPFGTENQVILNTAYQDQLIRFHNTLGAHFATWYRRQTVQSLARNPATHDYLHNVRILMTQHICRALGIDSAELTTSKEWQDLLDNCATLSLKLHGSEHDVLIRPLAPGSKYNDNMMMDVNDDDDDAMALDELTTTETDHDMERCIKSIVCPLFVDEQDTVLLPARVILE